MSSYSNDVRRLNHLHSEIEAAYHESSLRFGVSGSVLKILYAICDSGDSFPLSDVCRNTGLTKQTVNSAIRKLENNDMIYLEAVNGKSKRVCLTEKGKQFARGTITRLIEIENAIFDSWDKEKLEKYIELTEQYLL